MLNTKTARMLAHYKSWADKVMFDGVAALPPGEAEKERKTLFKSIIGTLNHIYVVDLIWQAHLERRESVPSVKMSVPDPFRKSRTPFCRGAQQFVQRRV